MGRIIEIVSVEFLVYFQMSFYLITTVDGNADTHFYPYCAKANNFKTWLTLFWGFIHLFCPKVKCSIFLSH